MKVSRGYVSKLEISSLSNDPFIRADLEAHIPLLPDVPLLYVHNRRHTHTDTHTQTHKHTHTEARTPTHNF